MNIVAVHGAEHKGSTYNIAKMVIDNLQADQITEYFLPKDMPYFCKGCGLCFTKGEEFCPHYEYVSPILKTIEQADILIFTSPVYVFHCSGQMKAFLDHFGYQWIVHRPNKTMFSKTALIISTAAGAGMKSTNKDIADSLNLWGVH
jgi:multimeric flavodoxin WrbA